MINLVTITQFFKAKYTSIFKYFLVARFTKNNLLRSIFIHFDIVEVNGKEILYLHYFM